MKLIGLITTAILSLTIGAAPVFAQQEQHEQEEQKAKPAQEEKKAQPEKAAKQDAPKAKPAQQAEKKAQPEKSAKQEKPSAQQQKSQPAQHAGGNGGGRIPADRYKAHFGREHTFRVSQSDYRNHRFQYGGYWFGFNDAWPSNWLYTQDVFVVEIDGVYYLCNASYPGVNVSLNITL